MTDERLADLEQLLRLYAGKPLPLASEEVAAFAELVAEVRRLRAAPREVWVLSSGSGEDGDAWRLVGLFTSEERATAYREQTDPPTVTPTGRYYFSTNEPYPEPLDPTPAAPPPAPPAG